jgi:hypothetical protein
MTTHSSREERIRLCSLRVRYRQAWRSQADSNTLASLLTAIESLNQSLNCRDSEQEPRMSADHNCHERGAANAQRIPGVNK